jgi:hypothetical protein
MMHFVTDHLLDAVFCFIIAAYSFKINQLGDYRRLGQTAGWGIKCIMVSAMCVVGLTLVGWFHPLYLDVASYISKIGINFGLCLALYAHFKLFE